MKQGNNLWEQLSKQTELPDEVFPGQSLIEIIGNQRILIEHHKGVLEYGNEQISVKVSYGIIQVNGRCMHLRYMTKQLLVISGSIHSVTLCRRRKE